MSTEWLAATVEVVDHDTIHDDRPNVFIQWKGTNVCFDFWCECGQASHYDGWFAYAFKCPSCGAVFSMPSTVYPHRGNPHGHEPVELDAG